MIENERQKRMVERVQEDERLRGDLPDDAALALVEWVGKQVAAAADPARPNAEVEAEVQAIRAAGHAAARSGETDPQRLLALAEAELTRRTASTTPLDAAAPATPAADTNLAAVGAGVVGSQPPKAQVPPSDSATDRPSPLSLPKPSS